MMVKQLMLNNWSEKGHLILSKFNVTDFLKVKNNF